MFDELHLTFYLFFPVRLGILKPFRPRMKAWGSTIRWCFDQLWKHPKGWAERTTAERKDMLSHVQPSRNLSTFLVSSALLSWPTKLQKALWRDSPLAEPPRIFLQDIGGLMSSILTGMEAEHKEEAHQLNGSRMHTDTRKHQEMSTFVFCKKDQKSSNIRTDMYVNVDSLLYQTFHVNSSVYFHIMRGL